MNPDELQENIKAMLKEAKDWFPDDTSKREGYLQALSEVLEMLEEMQ